MCGCEWGGAETGSLNAHPTPHAPCLQPLCLSGATHATRATPAAPPHLRTIDRDMDRSISRSSMFKASFLHTAYFQRRCG
jgi:hypothetical protein